MAGDSSLDLDSAYTKAVLIEKTDEVLAEKQGAMKTEEEAKRRRQNKAARKTPRISRGKSGASTHTASEDDVPAKLGDHLRLELAKMADED